MVHAIEELLQVHINHPAMSRRDMLAGAEHRIVRSSPWPKAEAAVRERGIEQGLQDLKQGLLNQSVEHRGNAQRSHPAVRLGNFHAPNGLGLILAAEQFLPHAW